MPFMNQNYGPTIDIIRLPFSSCPLFNYVSVKATGWLLSSFHLILLQMNCLLQEVQFTDQQRFKQFVSQSIARMEVGSQKILCLLHYL